MDTVQARLNYLFDLSGMSNYEISRHTLISEATLGRIRSEKPYKPQNATIMNAAVYLGVDFGWLKLGQGDPPKAIALNSVQSQFEDADKQEQTVPIKPLLKRANAKDKGDYHPEDGERYIRRTNEYVVVEEGNYRLKVKKVDQKAFAGYLAGWADPQYIESLPFTIVTVKEFHSGEYRSFEVSGDSMDYEGKRAIEDGDHVIGRRIEQDLWSSKLHIKQWREWVIVHDEGIVVKHIVKHDVENGIITCRSYNEDKIAYPDFDLHLDDVYELYNVVKVEKNR
ncbi:hypothetical protein [Dyadobacter fermentans]|uniref:hypothetical protein n=1 Tax=Dyadobacter fermentans TaxID=94254 RepID=UPI001CC0D788|nr:hypothetical protein [Dyadobacter fermentans]MBZ1361972.1 hypothetical protein [Dyadobacter fermentans]